MSKLANTAAAVLAAGAIGGGAYLVYDAEDEIEMVDDVVAVQVETPTVAIPKVSIPTVTTVSLSAVTISTPKVTTAAVEVTDAELANIGIATPESSAGLAPKASASSISPATVATADAAVQSALSAAGAAESVSSATAASESIPGVTVVDPTTRLPAVAALQKEVKTTFRDQRGIQQDNTITIDNGAFAAWLDIYRANAAYTPDPVALPSGLRMIAEVRVPEDAEQAEKLDSGLDYYASKGYNAVLLSFSGSEAVYDLGATAELIRAKGFKLWIAFGGPERLRHSVFVHPGKLRDCFEAVAPNAEGMFVGWRRTSCHLLLQDAPFTRWIMRTARTYNPRIAIVGEGYLGATAESCERTFHLSYNVPDNASGVLIVGIGYRGVAVESALAGLFKQVASANRLALILGDRPYYASKHSNALDFAANYEIKKALEKRFRAAGCTGTVTLHGDGSDGVYDPSKTDNLSTMEVPKMQ